MGDRTSNRGRNRRGHGPPQRLKQARGGAPQVSSGVLDEGGRQMRSRIVRLRRRAARVQATAAPRGCALSPCASCVSGDVRGVESSSSAPALMQGPPVGTRAPGLNYAPPSHAFAGVRSVIVEANSSGVVLGWRAECREPRRYSLPLCAERTSERRRLSRGSKSPKSRGLDVTRRVGWARCANDAALQESAQNNRSRA